jgi:hypothetical protein
MGKTRPKRYPVQLDRETYYKLDALATTNHRGLGGQVAWMVDQFYTALPKPDDAEGCRLSLWKEAQHEENV